MRLITWLIKIKLFQFYSFYPKHTSRWFNKVNCENHNHNALMYEENPIEKNFGRLDLEKIHYKIGFTRDSKDLETLTRSRHAYVILYLRICSTRSSNALLDTTRVTKSTEAQKTPSPISLSPKIHCKRACWLSSWLHGVFIQGLK